MHWTSVKNRSRLPDEDALCILGHEDRKEISFGYLRNGRWVTAGGSPYTIEFTHFKKMWSDPPLSIKKRINRMYLTFLVLGAASAFFEYVVKWETGAFFALILMINPVFSAIDIWTDHITIKSYEKTNKRNGPK